MPATRARDYLEHDAAARGHDEGLDARAVGQRALRGAEVVSVVRRLAEDKQPWVRRQFNNIFSPGCLWKEYLHAFSAEAMVRQVH